MDNERKNFTDKELGAELNKGKTGKLGGSVLVIVGIIVTIIGLVSGPSIVVCIIGVIIAAMGSSAKGKAKDEAGKKAYDAIVPELIARNFETVDYSPREHILDAECSNIPLIDHSHLKRSGAIRGKYRGLDTELCNIVLTDESQYQDENNGQWYTNEQELYSGQWLACKLGNTAPVSFTFWPRGKLDKLVRYPTVTTDNEDFNRRFNLSSNNEAETLRYLSPGRMQRILTLLDSSFGEVSVSLHDDGLLYIAVKSGHGFFDICKGKENVDALRTRYTRELKWFTDMVDIFNS